MEGKRLIHSLGLASFLSYGPATTTVELQPLNVLIGPNGSGKSNLLEALNVLRHTSRDLNTPFQASGVAEYYWKGSPDVRTFYLHAVVDNGNLMSPAWIRYDLSVTDFYQRPLVVSEYIADPVYAGNADSVDSQFFYSFSPEGAFLNVSDLQSGRSIRTVPQGEISPYQSVLTQRRDPYVYPEVTHVASSFERIAIFREGGFNHAAEAAQTNLPPDFLLPDGSNLALVLNDFQQRSDTRKTLLHYLQKFQPAAQFITTRVVAGTIQIFIDEGFSEPILATRLSSGTLRYLCLLAILCHPSPPPLVCLEEPELGLHPDILPTIAELMVEASQRTQLIVTTHSDALISALPAESVLVCERDQDGSHLRRLDPERLGKWLDEYSLGDLWRMGELGGTRW